MFQYKFNFEQVLLADKKCILIQFVISKLVWEQSSPLPYSGKRLSWQSQTQNIVVRTLFLAS